MIMCDNKFITHNVDDVFVCANWEYDRIKFSFENRCRFQTNVKFENDNNKLRYLNFKMEF